MWSILTDPKRKNGGWDIEEFFRTGEKWVDSFISEIEGLGFKPSGRCLDFGCGVGRLTQALCRRFETCDAVDIAPSMIELARKYNRYPDRCRYHVNDSPDLSMFSDGSFDFILSLIVLQHIEPRYTKRYIAEFVRVLRPGSIAAFQLPAALRQLQTRSILPLSGYRSAITPPVHHLALQAGQRLTMDFRVQNESDVVWPSSPDDGDAFARLNLGNHWLSHRGKVLQMDDGRTNLPKLRPGQEVVVPLTVTTPTKPGRYLLQFDLVEEGVTWFAQRGSLAPCIPVSTSASLRRVIAGLLSKERSADGVLSAPLMEMHCVPKAEVVDLIAKAGGTLIDCATDNACGDAYESYHYIVRRP